MIGNHKLGLGFGGEPQGDGGGIVLLDEPDTLHRPPPGFPLPTGKPLAPLPIGKPSVPTTEAGIVLLDEPDTLHRPPPGFPGASRPETRPAENKDPGIVLLDEPDTLHRHPLLDMEQHARDDPDDDRPNPGLRLPQTLEDGGGEVAETAEDDENDNPGLRLPGSEPEDGEEVARFAKVAERLALNLEEAFPRSEHQIAHLIVSGLSDNKTLKDSKDLVKASKQSFKILADGSLQIGGTNIPTEGVGTGKLENISSANLVELGSLGRGASGRVLKVFHAPSATILALKCISIGDKHKRDQLVKELSQLQSTISPYIVGFHGAFFQDGETKIALEYMNRGSLQSIVKECGVLPEPVLATIAKQTLQGLLHLHSHGKVHRDIKPGNILVNQKGEVKVSDLGLLSQPDNTMAVCSTFVGTLIYMSPERMNSEKYSFPADVWSLGMTIITCAVGSHPLSTQNGYWGMLSSISEQPPPTLPTTFSEPIRDFVSKCLIPDATKRWPCERLLKHDFLAGAPSPEESLKYWPDKLRMGAPPPPATLKGVRQTLKGIKAAQIQAHLAKLGVTGLPPSKHHGKHGGGGRPPPPSRGQQHPGAGHRPIPTPGRGNPMLVGALPTRGRGGHDPKRAGGGGGGGGGGRGVPPVGVVPIGTVKPIMLNHHPPSTRYAPPPSSSTSSSAPGTTVSSPPQTKKQMPHTKQYATLPASFNTPPPPVTIPTSLSFSPNTSPFSPTSISASMASTSSLTSSASSLQSPSSPELNHRVSVDKKTDGMTIDSKMIQREKCFKPKTASHDPNTCFCKVVIKRAPIVPTASASSTAPSTSTSPTPASTTLSTTSPAATPTTATNGTSMERFRSKVPPLPPTTPGPTTDLVTSPSSAGVSSPPPRPPIRKVSAAAPGAGGRPPPLPIPGVTSNGPLTLSLTGLVTPGPPAPAPTPSTGTSSPPTLSVSVPDAISPPPATTGRAPPPRPGPPPRPLRTPAAPTRGNPLPPPSSSILSRSPPPPPAGRLAT